MNVLFRFKLYYGTEVRKFVDKEKCFVLLMYQFSHLIYSENPDQKSVITPVNYSTLNGSSFNAVDEARPSELHHNESFFQPITDTKIKSVKIDFCQFVFVLLIHN